MVTKVVVQHLRKQIEKPQFGEIVVQNPPQELKPESFGWVASLMQCVVPIVSFLVIAWISNDIDVALVAAIISAFGTFISSLSYEVINSPKAISIRRTGRACFAVHGERFEEVQVFFSEAYDQNDAISRHQSDSVIKYIRSECDNGNL